MVHIIYNYFRSRVGIIIYYILYLLVYLINFKMIYIFCLNIIHATLLYPHMHHVPQQEQNKIYMIYTAFILHIVFYHVLCMHIFSTLLYNISFIQTFINANKIMKVQSHNISCGGHLLFGIRREG